MAKTEFQIILCTCPDAGTAESLARGLVEASLAACVNALPGVRSVYRWQGEVESGEEHLLLIKARAENYAAIEAYIKANHPYELPEIIAVPLAAGSAEYLGWLRSPDQTDK